MLQNFWLFKISKLTSKTIIYLNSKYLSNSMNNIKQSKKNKIKSKNAMSIRKIGKNDLQRYFELCNEENWGIGFARIEKMVLGFDFDYF